MNKECSIVQDILPLYVDEVCSDASKDYVENHLSGCNDCTNILNKLRSTEYVEELKTESNEVVAQHARKQMRKSAVVGMIFSAIYMIPIIVCMIVNIASGHGLSWFFIVLASLMVLASLTIVPLIAYKDKLLWTMGSFVGALVILLATVCIYTRGHWFFIAASSTMFGLGTVFVPISSFKINNSVIKQNKLLYTVAVNTALYIFMMLSIGLSVKNATFWTISFSISVVFFIYICGMVFAIRYLKKNGLTRAGVAIIWTGLFSAIAENLVFMFQGYSVIWHAFHPFIWNSSTIEANLHWINLFVGAFIGIIFILAGKAKSKKSKTNADVIKMTADKIASDKITVDTNAQNAEIAEIAKSAEITDNTEITEIIENTNN